MPPFILIIIILVVVIIGYDAYRDRRPLLEDGFPSILPSPPAADRRLAAKRTNETIKLSATYANNLGVGLVIGGLVGPTAAKVPIDPEWYSSLLLIAVALHMIGRLILGYLRNET